MCGRLGSKRHVTMQCSHTSPCSAQCLDSGYVEDGEAGKGASQLLFLTVADSWISVKVDL